MFKGVAELAEPYAKDVINGMSQQAKTKMVIRWRDDERWTGRPGTGIIYSASQFIKRCSSTKHRQSQTVPSVPSATKRHELHSPLACL